MKKGNISRVAFSVGTGRCGTMFLHQVINREPEVTSSHCREPEIETFHRYCKWYQLPVDDEGFFQAMNRNIQGDFQKAAISFESSPYLSLSITELYERFGAKFLLLIRDPVKVVQSHIAKGWYSESFQQADPNKALGYQKSNHFHHFLGRIAPRGEEYSSWNQLTQVGKCSWYWGALNSSVREQFKMLPESHWRIQKIEQLDFEAYKQLTQFFDFHSKLAQGEFDDIRHSRPNSTKIARIGDDWDETETREFYEQVADDAAKWGYKTLA